MSHNKAERGTHLVNDSQIGIDQNAVESFNNYDFFLWSASHNTASFTDAPNPETEEEIVVPVHQIISDLNQSLQSYDATKPVVLLPVRIETKYIGTDLWIRIFPDRIFIQTHEFALTQEELVDGQTYWNSYFEAEGVLSLQQEAWRLICTKYGTLRAAWIIRRLFPTNVNNTSTNPLLASFETHVSGLNNQANLFSEAYLGPEIILGKLEQTSGVLKNIASKTNKNTASSEGALKMAKNSMATLNETYVNHYNAVINPVDDRGTRRDMALHQAHLKLVATFDSSKKALNKLEVPDQFDQAFDSIHKELNGFKLTKKSTGEEISTVFLTVETKVSGIMRSFTGLCRTQADYFQAQIRLDEFLSEIESQGNRINPIIKQTEGDNIRRDERSVDTLLRITNSINATRISISEGGNKFTEIDGAWIEISRLVSQSPTNLPISKVQDRLLRLGELAQLVNTQSSISFRSAEDAIFFFTFLYNTIDSAINWLTHQVVITNNSERDIMIVVNNLSQARLELLSSYANSDNSIKEILAFYQLNNYIAKYDGSAWLKNVEFAIREVLSISNIASTSIARPETLAHSLTHFYNFAAYKYRFEINRPLVDGGYLGKGTLGSLPELFAPIKAIFQEKIKALVPTTNFLSKATFEILQVESEIERINPLYTYPSEVGAAVNEWRNKLQNARNAISGQTFTRSEADLMIEMLKSSQQSIQQDIDLKYSPQLNVLEEFDGRRNQEWLTEMHELLNAYEDTVKGIDDAIEQVNSGEEAEGELADFSFTISGSTPAFPTVLLKDKEWSEQAHSPVLPSRFVAIGLNEQDETNPNSISEDIVFVQPGRKINQQIRFGFDPNSDLDDEDTLEENEHFTFKIDDDGKIIAHPNILWLIDKDKALEDGMAIKVPNIGVDYLSRLIVVGVHDDPALSNHQTKLENLFISHQYTSGVSLLSAETPTNNTEDASSGYTTQDELETKSFATFAKNKLFTPTTNRDNITDGQFFAELLGLPYHLLYHVDGAEKKSIATGKLGARVLYPGTIGYHVEEVLDNLFNFDNRKKIREFFDEFVSARGLSPAMRIGSQPYGIMLTSHLHGYEVKDEANAEFTTDIYDENNQPYITLTGVDEYYRSILIPKVTTSLVSPAIWQTRFDKKAKEVLKFLDLEFRRIAQRFSKNVYKANINYHKDQLDKLLTLQEWYGQLLPEIDNAANLFVQPYPNYGQFHFMQVLGLLPRSHGFNSRFVTSTGSFNALQEIVTNYEVEPHFSAALSELDLNTTFHPLMCGLFGHRFRHIDLSSGYERVLNFMTAEQTTKGIYSYPDFNSVQASDPESLRTGAGLSARIWKKVRGTRAFLTTNAYEYVKLHGPLVNGTDDSNALKNYLQALAQENPFNVYNLNQFSTIPIQIAESGKFPLTFLLVRNSLLSKYREAACRLMVNEGILTWAQIAAYGTPENGLTSWLQIPGEDIPDNPSGSAATTTNALISTFRWELTKWDLLFNKLDADFVYLSSNTEKFRRKIGNNVSSEFSASFYDYGFLPMWSPNASGEYLDSPWKNSSLLKYLLPGVEQLEFGLYDYDAPLADDRKTIADYLFENPTVPGISGSFDIKNDLKKFKDDILALAEVSDEEMERILGENTDLSSNRLDAWIVGFFAKRLKTIRNRRNNMNLINPATIFNAGSYIGAYGYVENLKKNNTEAAVTNDTDPTLNKSVVDNSSLPNSLQLSNDELGTIYTDANNHGFIPAPSLSHAVTAAVLFSGYALNNLSGDSQVYNRSAINLTSERIRKA
ncbi:MAG: hypothetical protein ACKVOK_07445, partial [Flavobacteriales bacterium]